MRTQNTAIYQAICRICEGAAFQLALLAYDGIVLTVARQQPRGVPFFGNCISAAYAHVRPENAPQGWAHKA